MTHLQGVRGTHDLLPDDYRRFDAIVTWAQSMGRRYGYQAMATPMMEFMGVFNRTLGESSDIVSKEMFLLQKRTETDEPIALRPEFTAGIVRALIQHGLCQNLPLRFFSAGPVFRYERPQKGRQRQFHQINFEHFGATLPHDDVDILALAHHFLEALGIRAHTVLHINSLGDNASRAAYRSALVDYLTPYSSELSEDSQRRLVKNPLRILDSKDAGDRALLANAPRLHDYYNEATRTHFDRVIHGLDVLGIAYHHNPHLVRGMDYYTHTAFEFVTDQLGAQGTVLAGGRYDGLVKQMGGPDVPAIGFAAGIERLMEMTSSTLTPSAERPIVMIALNQACYDTALPLLYQARRAGLTMQLLIDESLSKAMKKANKMKASTVAILGPDEQANHQIQIKNFDTNSATMVSLAEMISHLQEN